MRLAFFKGSAEELCRFQFENRIAGKRVITVTVDEYNRFCLWYWSV